MKEHTPIEPTNSFTISDKDYEFNATNDFLDGKINYTELNNARLKWMSSRKEEQIIE